MKTLRNFIALSTLFALAVSYSCFAPEASADPPVIVVCIDVEEGDACLMPGSDADGNLIVSSVLGEVKIFVQADGMLILTCIGTNIDNFSGRGQHFKDFACGIDCDGDGEFDFIAPEGGQATVSATGKASFHCKVQLP